MPKRVAVYARVSTADQHTEPQLHALRAYCQARGLTVAEEFVDAGVSGAKDRRPALDRLLADARRRRFDAVACVKLDRLARSVRHLTAMAAELEAGRFLFHTLGAVAELERDLIRDRTRAGLAAARRRGATIGRPRALLPIHAGRLRELLEVGASDRAIGRELGCAAATVAREARRLGLRAA